MSFDEDAYREKMRRWSLVELPRYEVDGWAGSRHFGGGSESVSSLAGVETHVALSSTVLHQRGDGVRVEVSSHRQDAGRDVGRTQAWALNVIRDSQREPGASLARQAHLEQESSRLRSDAHFRRLHTRTEMIPVDGLPTAFEVFEAEPGYWAAFGHGRDVDLTVDTRGVPIESVALVRVVGPAPSPQWAADQPVAPTRQFPAELIAAPSAKIPMDRRVDLTYRNAKLVGVLGGADVSLSLPLLKWASRESVTGSIAGGAVTAEWTMLHVPAPTGSQSYSAALAGRLNRLGIDLQAVLDFNDGYPFARAAVTGRVGEEVLQAEVEPLNGGLGPDAFAVDGTLGDREFSVFVTLNNVPNRAVVRGRIFGETVYVDAELRHSGGRHVHLAGHFTGNPVLLIVVLGGVFQFLH